MRPPLRPIFYFYFCQLNYEKRGSADISHACCGMFYPFLVKQSELLNWSQVRPKYPSPNQTPSLYVYMVTTRTSSRQIYPYSNDFKLKLSIISLHKCILLNSKCNLLQLLTWGWLSPIYRQLLTSPAKTRKTV